ncbi:hypothetical protein Ais01nite_21800 [Asanoa ishikariensis]|uniref:Uncharacterized protein n=1 Tax=Asanoa ishikariensis TaxID=137265 RepID=A0A1H3U7Q2_9ACTN|nr:hypothetical protein [Asanoa ishikariensis]GIF64145.1 hypothetical protein Ais01nite_21800 [Asanoa ishikariensis]SDZ58317.1 hypothetical protein SAMN05421684_6694 [Asanoa ishikariensis]
MKKQTLSVLAVATVVYNTAVLVKNVHQARANPTLANVAGLIVASGVLIGSLRSY